MFSTACYSTAVNLVSGRPSVFPPPTPLPGRIISLSPSVEHWMMQHMEWLSVYVKV